MKIETLRTRMPLSKLGETTLVVMIGQIELEVGEVVHVANKATKEHMSNMVVQNLIHTKIMDTPSMIMDVFDCPRHTAFRQMISSAARTGMPAETLITVVMVGEDEVVSDPASLETEYEGEWDELTSDDDIPELVYPFEDVDEDADE